MIIAPPPLLGWFVTNLRMLGDPMVDDLDDQKESSLQNFRPLGEVEAYNLYNGVGRDLFS